MTANSKPTAGQKIARLRTMFLEQLPHRLELAKTMFDRLKHDAADMDAMTELHRCLHSLKGTGRSFGFIKLGAIADTAEQLSEKCKSGGCMPLPLSWVEKMDSCINELEQVVSELQHPHEMLAPEHELYDLSMLKPYWPDKEYGGKLIYICDDDTLLTEQLTNQLVCFGYQTNPFTELDSLITALNTRVPDALVMDINFPEGRYAGTDLVAAIRKDMRFQFPVIFVSGRDDFDARLSAVLADGAAYFTKPLHVLELVSSLDELTRQQKPEPYRILVVDDEPVVSDYHSVLLQEAGMLTRTVNEPDNILGVLQEFRPDLVLMDMYMPACSGHDLARLIRQVHEYMALPIVYLSSETDTQKQFSAMRIGAEGFLTKPVVPGELVAAVAIRAERMRSLRSLMVRDSLTGLFNHTTTSQLLETSIANTRRHGSCVSFVMIDLDNFKKVNDSFGHPVGDQVLLAMARILKQRLRTSDVIGRYGGEEFALVLQEVSSCRAAELVNELRRDFENLFFNSGELSFSCTFSAGIASFPKYSNLAQLREAADKALYQAKKNGRNQVVIADGGI